MKKIISLFLVILLTPLAAFAAQYQAGEHYTVVNENLSSKPEVREYFSYYCPHCMKFEPFMQDLKKGLPEGVKFEKNHVDFLRAASPEVQFSLTKASVVADQLGQEYKLSGAIFNYIHKQRAAFTSEKDIRNVFVLNGVDGEKFDKLMKSFSINSKAKQMKKKQDYFSGKGVLTGVPTIIVNDKYRVNADKLDRNDFVNDYKNLVHYLLTLK
jgi:thiol:disulfide interchange protein DsbA